MDTLFLTLWLIIIKNIMIHKIIVAWLILSHSLKIISTLETVTKIIGILIKLLLESSAMTAHDVLDEASIIFIAFILLMLRLYQAVLMICLVDHRIVHKLIQTVEFLLAFLLFFYHKIVHIHSDFFDLL